MSESSYATTLSALKRLYPFGVPSRFLVEQKKSGPRRLENTLKKLAFVGSIPGSSEGAPYSGPGGELLAAAITKGLKLSLNDVVLLNTDSGSGATFDEVSARVLVLFDSAFQEVGANTGTVSEHRGKRVIRTHGLAAILASQQSKREFWEHLKLLGSLE